MVFDRLLLFLLYAALLRCSVSEKSHNSSDNWVHARRIELSLSNVLLCEDSCRHDSTCAEYVLRKSESSTHDFDCYMLSEEVMLLKKSAPALFGSSSNNSSINGLKSQLRKSRREAHVSQLLKGPKAADSTSALTYRQHFVAGCSYTVSVWAWLWKSRHRPDKYDSRAILSTRTHIDGAPEHFRDSTFPLLPTILFNTGEKPDHFFFSASLDKRNSYIGLWPANAPVRFNSWIHFVLVIQHNVMKIYIDGRYLDYVSIPFHAGNMPVQQLKSCVYDLPVVRSLAHISAGGADRRSSNDSVSIYDSNTVLQLGGIKNRRSTVGLFDNLVVFRNAALNASQVRALHSTTRPRELPTFNHLSSLYHVYNMDGFCPLTIRDNFFLQRHLGLCPDILCGEVCLSEHFWRNPTYRSEFPVENIEHRIHQQQQQMHSANRDAATQVVVLHSEQELQLKPAASWTKARTGRIPLQTFTRDESRVGLDGSAVPGIGEIRGVKSAKSASTSGRTTRSEPIAAATTTATAGNAPTVIQLLQDAFWYYTAKFLSRTDASTKATIADIAAPLCSEQTGADDGASTCDTWSLRADSDGLGETFHMEHGALSSSQTRAQSLYRLAMLWMRARNEDYYETAHMTVWEWRRVLHEKYFSALALALFFADDSSDYADQDVGWNFLYPGLTAQPIHIALGYLEGYDHHEGLEVLEQQDGHFRRNLLADVVGENHSLHSIFTAQHPEPATPRLAALPQLQSSSTTPDEHIVEFPKEDILKATAAVDWLREFSITTVPDLHQLLQRPEFAPLRNAGVYAELVRQLRDRKRESRIEPPVTTEADFVKAAVEERRRTAGGSGGHDALASEDLEAERVMRGLLTVVASSDGYVVVDSVDMVVEVDSSQGPAGLAKTAGESKAMLDDRQCLKAASHYFPVSQFSASHFGVVSSGVGLLEEINLLQVEEEFTGLSAFSGHWGETDLAHVHTEAEALQGDPHAQTWLGKKYFWGFGGIPRDENLAREWFQRAADQNDPEGLYNIAAMYNDGRGGLPRNRKLALEYFNRSATAPLPFSMAQHAMGNHYLHDAADRNVTLAREFFFKAAANGSPEGDYALAMLYRVGQGGPVEIPRCVHHLARAASHGHVRSLNFLAHALVDQESWLATYGRFIKLHLRAEDIAAELNRTEAAVTVPGSPDDSEAAYTESDLGNLLALWDAYGGDESKKATKSALASKLTPGSSNTTIAERTQPEPVVIYVNGESVRLPQPLGNTDGSCQAALPLLKRLSDLSYRTRDVSRLALEAFLGGKLWEALELYEEAAQLGLRSAHSSIIYLYGLLQKEICDEADNFNANRPSDSQKLSNKTQTLLRKFSTHHECNVYFERMVLRALLHLSNMGDTKAMRKVANRALPGQMTTNYAALLGLAPNSTRSSQLFVLAAEAGDVESVMALGWMMFSGTKDIPRNLTSAGQLFAAAQSLEQSGQFGRWRSTSSRSSAGLAPAVARSVVWLEQALQSCCGSNLATVQSAVSGYAVAIQETLTNWSNLVVPRGLW